MSRHANAALWIAWLVVGMPAAQAQGLGGLDAMEAVLTRTSVRAFDPNRPPTEGELRAIMDAGYRTQTLDGSRPFEFVQIRDRATLAAVGESGKYANWMADAPAAIAIVLRTRESPRFYRENGAMAVLNMAYAAQRLGLGTCFLGTRNNNKMKAALGIGDNRHLLTVIPVGAPKPGSQPKSPKRYPVEWTVSQGTYGGTLTAPGNATPVERTGRPIGAFLRGRHTTVEEFDTRPVEQTQLATALEAMRHAPSSKNKQHWRWVLVTDVGAKQRVAKAAGDRQLAQAPVVAVLAGSQDSRPFVNPRGWGRRRTSPTFINHGAAMALRNLQIGAESQGLGVRIKGLSKRADRRLRVSLSPDGQKISGKRAHFICAVGLGHAKRTTTGTVGPIPRSRIFNERYGATAKR
jgi:nitroreductase